MREKRRPLVKSARGDIIMVMPSVARHLLFIRKWKLTPFELTPERQRLVLGGVGGGLCPPPLKEETPRRFTPRSDGRMVFGEP